MSSKLDRINEDIKRVLSRVIQEEMKNPDMSPLVSVTSVKVTNELKFAKVLISAFGTEWQKEQTIKTLKKSKGFLKGEIAKKLNLRNTPELIFQLDEALEQGSRINELLSTLDIKKDEEENEEDA